MATSEVYRVAVIGAGSGGRLSIKGAVASPRYELVAVADQSAQARRAIEEEFPSVLTFADHKSLLAATDVDVVCVSTWPPSHLPITKDALASGLKGIVVEKPLGDTYAAGAGVMAAVRRYGVPMVVPHGLLVADHSRAILDLVAGGAIGTLKVIEIECASWDIINAGIHWLNFALSLLPGDQAKSVLALCDTSTRTFRDGMQVETEAITYVTMASGVRLVMHTGDFVPIAEPNESFLFRLVGSEGLLEFFGWKPYYWLMNQEYPKGQRFDVAVQARSNHQRYLEILAEQMDAGVIDLTWGERSLAALELCEAAYLSSRIGGAVTLPLATFVPQGRPEWDAGRPYSGSGGGRDGRRLAEIG
jgi:predicted dehydrogenase